MAFFKIIKYFRSIWQVILLDMIVTAKNFIEQSILGVRSNGTVTSDGLAHHENVRRTHTQAGLLWTACKRKATTRSTQALQGRTEAEPEDLWNTTNRAQQHHDCPRILAISLPRPHWRLGGHTCWRHLGEATSSQDSHHPEHSGHVIVAIVSAIPGCSLRLRSQQTKIRYEMLFYEMLFSRVLESQHESA